MAAKNRDAGPKTCLAAPLPAEASVSGSDRSPGRDALEACRPLRAVAAKRGIGWARRDEQLMDARLLPSGDDHGWLPVAWRGCLQDWVKIAGRPSTTATSRLRACLEANQPPYKKNRMSTPNEEAGNVSSTEGPVITSRSRCPGHSSGIAVLAGMWRGKLASRRYGSGIH